MMAEDRASTPANATVRACSFTCLLLGCTLSLAACSSSSNTPADAHAGTGGVGDSGRPATGGGSGAPANGGMAGTEVSGGSAGSSGAQGGREAGDGGSTGGSQEAGGSGGSDVAGEYGFTFRKPSDENLDWLCTFHDGAEPGYVYARLLQTGTSHIGIAETPVYSVELAQLSVKGAVSALEGAKYDYGGGHHNDSLSFDHAGKSHRFYHSSFGFGFRSCQPMDCRSVYGLGTTTLETEGCASSRSLPEVCVAIKPDASHDPLVDKFMKCPGDSQ
jgi:hypothetical protein